MLKCAAFMLFVSLSLLLACQSQGFAQPAKDDSWGKLDKTEYKLVVPPTELKKINSQVTGELKGMMPADLDWIWDFISEEDWPASQKFLTAVCKPDLQTGNRKAFLKGALAMVYFNTGKYGRCLANCIQAERSGYKGTGLNSMKSLSDTVLRMGNSYCPEDKEFSRRAFH